MPDQTPCPGGGIGQGVAGRAVQEKSEGIEENKRVGQGGFAKRCRCTRQTGMVWETGSRSRADGGCSGSGRVCSRRAVSRVERSQSASRTTSLRTSTRWLSSATDDASWRISSAALCSATIRPATIPTTALSATTLSGRGPLSRTATIPSAGTAGLRSGKSFSQRLATVG